MTQATRTRSTAVTTMRLTHWSSILVACAATTTAAATNDTASIMTAATGPQHLRGGNSPPSIPAQEPLVESDPVVPPPQVSNDVYPESMSL